MPNSIISFEYKCTILPASLEAVPYFHTRENIPYFHPFPSSWACCLQTGCPASLLSVPDAVCLCIRAPSSSHICYAEPLHLTIFLQKMRLLWLLFKLGVHGQELMTKGLLHRSKWHCLLRQHFRIRHNLTTTTTTNQCNYRDGYERTQYKPLDFH